MTFWVIIQLTFQAGPRGTPPETDMPDHPVKRGRDVTLR